MGHRLVARLQRRLGPLGMLPTSEDVAVDLERHSRIGMAELAADVDDIEASGDEWRRIPMAERMERQPTIGPDTGPADRQSERLADLAIVKRPTDGVREDRGIGTLPRRRQPAVSQQPDDCRS